MYTLIYTKCLTKNILLIAQTIKLLSFNSFKINICIKASSNLLCWYDMDTLEETIQEFVSVSSSCTKVWPFNRELPNGWCV